MARPVTLYEERQLLMLYLHHGYHRARVKVTDHLVLRGALAQMACSRLIWIEQISWTPYSLGLTFITYFVSWLARQNLHIVMVRLLHFGSERARTVTSLLRN